MENGPFIDGPTRNAGFSLTEVGRAIYPPLVERVPTSRDSSRIVGPINRPPPKTRNRWFPCENHQQMVGLWYEDLKKWLIYLLVRFT